MSVARALTRALELRDPMTARHSVAVAEWTRKVATAAGMGWHERRLAHVSALLHDIGKLMFSDRILKANVSLTESDWEQIHEHPAAGARALEGITGYEPVREIILTHHERFDGDGYPNGIRGADVPPIARIIAVADTYDAMIARDSYREPVSPDDAIAELRRVSGSQLDPRFVELFVEAHSKAHANASA